MQASGPPDDVAAAGKGWVSGRGGASASTWGASTWGASTWGSPWPTWPGASGWGGGAWSYGAAAAEPLTGPPAPAAAAGASSSWAAQDAVPWAAASWETSTTAEKEADADPASAVGRCWGYPWSPNTWGIGSACGVAWSSGMPAWPALLPAVTTPLRSGPAALQAAPASGAPGMAFAATWGDGGNWGGSTGWSGPTWSCWAGKAAAGRGTPALLAITEGGEPAAGWRPSSWSWQGDAGAWGGAGQSAPSWFGSGWGEREAACGSSGDGAAEGPCGLDAAADGARPDAAAPSEEAAAASATTSSTASTGGNGPASATPATGSRGASGRPLAGAAAKVFVSGLAWDTTSEMLKAHFAQVGDVVFCAIDTDRETGRPRGTGKVEFASADIAEMAISMMHGTGFRSRRLTVRAFGDIPSRQPPAADVQRGGRGEAHLSERVVAQRAPPDGGGPDGRRLITRPAGITPGSSPGGPLTSGRAQRLLEEPPERGDRALHGERTASGRSAVPGEAGALEPPEVTGGGRRGPGAAFGPAPPAGRRRGLEKGEEDWDDSLRPVAEEDWDEDWAPGPRPGAGPPGLPESGWPAAFGEPGEAGKVLQRAEPLGTDIGAMDCGVDPVTDCRF